MSNLISDTWSIDGVTVNNDGVLSYLGDYDMALNSYCLYFNLESEENIPIIKKIKIKDTLKYINSTAKDYIKDGIVYRNIGVIETNRNTFFEIDSNAWDNSGETFGFYLSNPLLIKKESKVYCNKLDVLSSGITKGNERGIKCYENVIGIRDLKSNLGITDAMTLKEIKSAISNYLEVNRLVVLYELLSKEYENLEDYAFILKSYDNNISNVNTNSATYFHIDYPVEIIINNTIDIRQIQNIQTYVSEIFNSVLSLKSEVENYKTSIDHTAIEVSNLKEVIDSKSDLVASSLERITTIEDSVDTLYADIVQKLSDINATLDAINALKVYFDSINSNINNFEDKLGNSIYKIEPGSEDNTLLVTNHKDEQTVVNIPVGIDLSNYYTKENVDIKVTALNERITEVADAEINYEKIDTSKLIFNTAGTDLVATNISQVIKELNGKILSVNQALSPITDQKINELCI